MNVTADMLSETKKETRKSYNHNKEPTDEKTNKLISNAHDKQNYVCHVKVLQYYPKQGLKIKRVHRTISFKSNYCWFHCHRCCGWCCWYGCCRHGCCSCCYCCMGCSYSWLRWRGGAGGCGGCGGCGDDGEYFALAIFEALACNI